MMPSKPRAKVAVLAWSSALLLAWGCGGGSAGSKPASSADEAPSAGAEESSTPESEEGESAGTESASAPPATCDDGTCTPCGDGICPAGWYCDEGAKGGPACGWLPECAQKPGCACLTRELAGCRCEEKEGGIHLSCG